MEDRLRHIWATETYDQTGAPDFAKIVRDSAGNVRSALHRLEGTFPQDRSRLSADDSECRPPLRHRGNLMVDANHLGGAPPPMLVLDRAMLPVDAAAEAPVITLPVGPKSMPFVPMASRLASSIR